MMHKEKELNFDVYVDSLNEENFENTYSTWPERSFIIENGKIVFTSQLYANDEISCEEYIDEWLKENQTSFNPPVCNKLMYKNQLSVMFVGAPNTRTDFHMEAGSEFFYQLKGDIELPTIQAGKRKLVRIKEGEVFLLPSRVPHSPQRPNPGSIGLVIERHRYEHEIDCLRWYTDFGKCEDILWQHFFYCDDLGRDLVPVVKAFKESEAFKTNYPDATTIPSNPPLVQDVTTFVPDPFSLSAWLDSNKTLLNEGKELNLFHGHPDKEFSIKICGGDNCEHHTEAKLETWVYQIKGTARFVVESPQEEKMETILKEGSCGIIPIGVKYSVLRFQDSIGMVVTQDPKGNAA